MLDFRLLRADEIDARIATVGAWGVQLLLYKDARCDQNILDETVGMMNWQRHHTRDNANCVVAIWDAEKKQWIEKEDTGTESFTEKEKGLASDSFKRACFNWGIGRELYTAPQMFVGKNDLKTLTEKNGKWTCKDYFEVVDIQYEDKKIASVRVLNTKTGEILEFTNDGSKRINKPAADDPVFDRAFFEAHGNDKITSREITRLQEACKGKGDNLSIEKALAACRREKVEDINFAQYYALMQQLDSAA